MQAGAGRRRERREKLRGEREAAILARAESSMTYLDLECDNIDAPSGEMSGDDAGLVLPVDLMDFDDNLSREEARLKHHQEMSGTREFFLRK